MSYKLKNLDTVLSHWPVVAWVLHDQTEEPLDKFALEALLSSEDYFVVLATRLDQLASSLQKSNNSDYIVLEQTIKELLYLHQMHTIKKRSL